MRVYDILWYIMTIAVILHNMINKNECGQDLDYSYEFMGKVVCPIRRDDSIRRFLQVHYEIRDQGTREDLQRDPIE